MSYFNMDHARWAARQIEMDIGAMSIFHRRAFDILGIAFGGIYNAPISWGKVELGANYLLIILRDGSKFATWDGNILTYLVFLCHEARIRLEIEARTRGYLRLHLSQRTGNSSFASGHPNLTEAVKDFRKRLGKNHHIIFENEVQSMDEIG